MSVCNSFYILSFLILRAFFVIILSVYLLFLESTKMKIMICVIYELIVQYFLAHINRVLQQESDYAPIILRESTFERNVPCLVANEIRVVH